MQYVVWRGKKDDYELFSDDNGEVATIPTLTHETYLKLEDFLKAKRTSARLLDKVVGGKNKNFPLFSLIRAKTRENT